MTIQRAHRNQERLMAVKIEKDFSETVAEDTEGWTSVPKVGLPLSPRMPVPLRVRSQTLLSSCRSETSCISTLILQNLYLDV